VSGGVDIEGSGAQGRMGESRPILGDDLRRASTDGATGWRTSASDLTGGSKDIDFYAICKESGAGGLKYRKEKRNFAPAKTKTAKARCPDGYRVIGGGLQSANPVVLATAPFDAGDPDSKPDDGWRIRATNASAQPQELIAHAVCRAAGAWQLSYRSVSESVSGGTTDGTTRSCPAGAAVTGGGVRIDAGPGAARLFEMFPAGGAPPQQAWFGAITNLSMGSISATVHAICRV
jgi:hypothetical protein